MSDGWPWAEHFEADGPYFATATSGLPPRRTSEAMSAVLEDWRRGRLSAPDFDRVIERARRTYARLTGVDAGTVAIGHQVSALVGMVAGSVPDGARILTATGEFTSVTFPFAAHEHRGVRVREVPLEAVADAVDDGVDLVAVSAVQSADGALADLTAITEAAGEHPWDSIYGLPLRLAADARRFDVSPGWFSWVGTDASLSFLDDIGSETCHEHALEAAAAFATAAGLEPGVSAIRSLVADASVAALMGEAGATGSVRAGRLRLAFHVNNTVEEAEALGRLLRGHVRE